MSNYLIHYGVKGMKWKNHQYATDIDKLSDEAKKKYVEALRNKRKNYISSNYTKNKTGAKLSEYMTRKSMNDSNENKFQKATQRSNGYEPNFTNSVKNSLNNVSKYLNKTIDDISNSDWYKKGKSFFKNLFD